MSKVLKIHRSIRSKIKKYTKSIKRLKAFSNNKKDIKELVIDVCFLAKLECISFWASSNQPFLEAFEDFLNENFEDDPTFHKLVINGDGAH